MTFPIYGGTRAVQDFPTAQSRGVGADVILYITCRVALLSFSFLLDMDYIDESRHEKGNFLHQPQGTGHGSSEESSVRVHRVSNFGKHFTETVHCTLTERRCNPGTFVVACSVFHHVDDDICFPSCVRSLGFTT